MYAPHVSDDGRYMTYYMNQAGGAMPGFIGTSTQYGNGLGGMFRSLFRMALPLLRRGLNIAKPHLKTAATGIMGDVVSNIARSAMPGHQEGNGFIVRTARPRKRPPSVTAPKKKKRNKTPAKTQSRSRKKAAPKRRRTSSARDRPAIRDIF